MISKLYPFSSNISPKVYALSKYFPFPEYTLLLFNVAGVISGIPAVSATNPPDVKPVP